jgi:hypothetical protein
LLGKIVINNIKFGEAIYSNSEALETAKDDIDLSTMYKSDKDLNWATDENWVRAAANLEAETGVDILIGADLGNNLSSIRQSLRFANGYKDLDDEYERWESTSNEDEAQIEISLISSITHAISTRLID